MSYEDRLWAIARDLDTLAHNRLLTREAQDNLKSAAFLVRELSRYDGTQFDTPRLMHAVTNVRNSQA